MSDPAQPCPTWSAERLEKEIRNTEQTLKGSCLAAGTVAYFERRLHLLRARLIEILNRRST
jgi:hypothetical protein